jgi:hypothetical protein
MKPLNCPKRSGWIQRLTPAAVLTSLLLLFTLFNGTAGGAGVVTNCTESALRAAISGGGTVTFACDGTIVLTGTITNTDDTTLDGSGHQIIISGANAARVFAVGSNVEFVLVKLTIAHGWAGVGAGILNSGGKVYSTNCAFFQNTVTNVNSLTTGGGAIMNESGLIQLSMCAFYGNQARANVNASGYGGAESRGGAICNNGTLILDSCSFMTNSASGAPGTWQPGMTMGGQGAGGAIYNAGTLQASRSTFGGNEATGGTGGPGANGIPWQDIATDGGPGGPGGSGAGAGLYNSGLATLNNNTFAGNVGRGGAGGTGGTGGTGQLIGGNGGLGGAGGAGFGAIYDLSGLLSLTNCTLALNHGNGGSGGTGGMGGGHLSPSGWSGSPGASGSSGAGTGGIKSSGCWLVNTILATNNDNGSASLADGGHNLSSDASCAFTGTGSQNNTDPHLGQPADNGGPTLTMALLPGSPAIDAGTAVGAPATDQRGIARPQGPGVDIGAFEYQYIPLFSCPQIDNSTNCLLQLSGLLPNQTFSVEASPDLSGWFCITNLVAGTNGQFQFIDPIHRDAPARFYRVKSLSP